jgi:hypothetical protein
MYHIPTAGEIKSSRLAFIAPALRAKLQSDQDRA